MNSEASPTTDSWLTAILDGRHDTAIATAVSLIERQGAEAGTAGLMALTMAMRASGFDPDICSAALTQATLRQRAVSKFGQDAARMFFTRAGLEQATRSVVATRRACRLSQALAERGTLDSPLVTDLGCGVGADAIALARAGLRVSAVEIDPLTASVATANMSALGLDDRVTVVQADATTADLHDAVFCDPARRTSRGRRVFDPALFQPPWEFVSRLPSRVPMTVLKLAPGIDHGLLPAGCEAEWVSVHGQVVEATCWCGPLANHPRRATVIRNGVADELTGSGDEQGIPGPVRRYLFDPDGAVVRAHLVAEFAQLVRGTLADPTIAYVYAEAPAETPFGHCYEVLEQLPVAVKRMRAALRERRVGSLTILKRGSALDVERLRRDLRLSGDQPATIVLTRVAGAPAVLLCRLVDPAPGGPSRRSPA